MEGSSFRAGKRILQSRPFWHHITRCHTGFNDIEDATLPAVAEAVDAMVVAATDILVAALPALQAALRAAAPAAEMERRAAEGPPTGKRGKPIGRRFGFPAAGALGDRSELDDISNEERD